ncbi:MAG: nuclear transport factor 2 family protein [Novosphingobium sp.]|nr:nuclear transport factor 2 family protein [Novosphingobium sp.]MCP5402156.1 nuclear transport factor 2 family protein [Novosphingobium sp.]
MSTEENKKMAIELLQASAIHDGKRFDELLHPDATYWVIGKPHLFAYGGEQTREQIVAYMSTPSIFVGGVQTTFGDITAEDDRVALEAETKGTLPDGRVYTNVYHYLMKFKDGKIIRVKEYLDTQSAAEFFSK